MIDLPDSTPKPPRDLLWLGVAALVALLVAALPFLPSLAKGMGLPHFVDRVTGSGLVLTFEGFVITLWQLLRTRSASIAAQTAVTNLQFRFSDFENANLCARCKHLGREIMRQNASAQASPSRATYIFLPERYVELRLALVGLRKRLKHVLSEGDQTIIQSALSKLADAHKSVERSLAKDSTKAANLRPLQGAMQPLLEFLETQSLDLEQRAMGDRK